MKDWRLGNRVPSPRIHEERLEPRRGTSGPLFYRRNQEDSNIVLIWSLEHGLRDGTTEHVV